MENVPTFLTSACNDIKQSIQGYSKVQTMVGKTLVVLI